MPALSSLGFICSSLHSIPDNHIKSSPLIHPYGMRTYSFSLEPSLHEYPRLILGFCTFRSIVYEKHQGREIMEALYHLLELNLTGKLWEIVWNDPTQVMKKLGDLHTNSHQALVEGVHSPELSIYCVYWQGASWQLGEALRQRNV